MKNTKMMTIKKSFPIFFDYLDKNNIKYIYDSFNNFITVKNQLTIENRKYSLIEMKLKYVQNDDCIDMIFPKNILFEKGLTLGWGYNYYFGNKTKINNLFETNMHNVIIKSLGNSFVVNGMFDFYKNTIIEQFPIYLNVSGQMHMPEAKCPPSLGKTTIIGDVFDAKDSDLEDLGNNFFSIGGHVYLDGTNITQLPKNMLSKNKNDIIYLSLCNLKNKKISLPNNFKKIKNEFYIACTNTLVENIYEFKNNKNFEFLSLIDDYKKIIKNNKESKKNFIKKDIIDFKCITMENAFMNENTVLIMNAISYLAPHSLYSKLLLNRIDDITNKELSYFNRNKNHFNLHKKFTKNNIIYYCRSYKAIQFLSKNGYDFNEEECKNIPIAKIKNFYEKELLACKFKKII